MQICIAGATGVVGRRLIPLLTAAEHSVTALARSAEKQQALQQLGITAALATYDDPVALRQAVAGHDAVINLATHIPSSSIRMLFRSSWRENDIVRRDGSAALADAALSTGVPRFIQESFAPIYEDAGDGWIDETSPVRPVAYNESVLDAERSAARVTQAGHTGVVLRFALFYGPDSKLTQELLGTLKFGWSPVPGAPAAFMSSIAHDDAASAVAAALTAPAGVYNACDDEPLRRGEWAAVMAQAVGARAPKALPGWLMKFGGSAAELLSRSQRVSNAKLRSATGWAPRFPSVREGAATLRDTNKRQVV